MAAGAVSLKNLTKREEVRKGADQANNIKYFGNQEKLPKCVIVKPCCLSPQYLFKGPL